MNYTEGAYIIYSKVSQGLCILYFFEENGVVDQKLMKQMHPQAEGNLFGVGPFDDFNEMLAFGETVARELRKKVIYINDNHQFNEALLLSEGREKLLQNLLERGHRHEVSDGDKPGLFKRIFD